MLKRLSIITAICLGTGAFAQVSDDAPGFFDRLFGSDTAENDEEQGGFLERLIEDNLSGENRTVEITGFAGALQGKATMDKLTISDGEGVWLTLTDAVLDWNRSALFRGSLEVTELSAAEILLPRAPAPAKGAAPTPEASGFALPELPVSVDIDKISAKRLFIGAPVIGAEANVTLSGSLALSGGEGDAALAIEHLDGSGALSLETAYSNTLKVLALDLALNEAEDGLFAALVGLPGRPSVAFSIKGEAPISAYAAEIHLATDGTDRLGGTIATTASEEDGARRFSVDVGGDIAPVFAPDYRPFFGDQIRLAANATRFDDGRLSLSQLSLTANALSLQGDAVINADGLPEKAQLSGTITSDTGLPVLLPLAGAKTYVDRVDLNLDFDAGVSEDWSAVFQIRNLDRAGFRARALRLNGSGRVGPGPAAAIEAAFTFDAEQLDFSSSDTQAALGEDVTGQARLNWRAGGSLQLEHLQVSGRTYAFDGAATVAFEENGPLVNGNARLRIDQLAAFSGLVKRPLGGAVAVESDFTAAPLSGTFGIDAKGTGQDLSVDQPEVDRILAGAVRLDLTASRNETGVSVSLRDLSSPTTKLTGAAELNSGNSALQITGSLTDSALLAPGLSGPLELKIRGNENERRDWFTTSTLVTPDIDLAVAGTFSGIYATPRFDGNIAATSENLSAFSMLADRPLDGRARVQADAGVAFDLSQFNVLAEVQGASLSIGQPEIDTLLGQSLEARIDASGSPKDLLISAFDLQTTALAAQASGRLSETGSSLDLEARLAEIAPFAEGFSGPLALTGEIGRDEAGTYLVDLTAEGPSGSRARVDGTVAADTSTASLSMTGTAPLGLANRFIAPRAIAGTGGFDLRLEGPLQLSGLSGRLTTAGARLVAPELGVALEDITLNAALANSQADLNLTARVDEGGRLSLSGPVGLAAPFNGDLELRLDGVVLSDSRLYETTTDGAIRIDGPLAGGASISGKVEIGETNIQVPSSGFGGSGPIPEILHIKEPPPVRATRERAGLLNIGGSAQTSDGPSYGLDITIDAPKRIFIRGRGLESEFGGQIRITGTTRDVVPLGAFSLIRGRLDILGRRLELDDARVTMRGSLEPYLDLRASTQVDEYVINVLVIGPASRPEITFSAVPDLPQEEVLARLIFGRDLETLSPFQAAQLALAVRTLAGQGGEGIVGKIRGATGLADLDVVSGEDGGTAVRAGTYINDSLYTDVTVDSTGESEVNLNLDLTPSITLKGGATTTGDTSLGIFFERDY